MSGVSPLITGDFSIDHHRATAGHGDVVADRKRGNQQRQRYKNTGSHCSKARNPSSSVIFTLSSVALSNFDPASLPAITKSVFLLTEPETLPPASSIIFLASSRLRFGSVPVRTKVLPASLVPRALRSPVNWRPAPSNRLTSSRLRGSAKNSTIA